MDILISGPDTRSLTWVLRRAYDEQVMGQYHRKVRLYNHETW